MLLQCSSTLISCEDERNFEELFSCVGNQSYDSKLYFSPIISRITIIHLPVATVGFVIYCYMHYYYWIFFKGVCLDVLVP